LEKEDRKEVLIRDLSEYDKVNKCYRSEKHLAPRLNDGDSDEEDTYIHCDPARKPSKKSSKKRKQKYIHFGLRSSLVGESVGITHRRNYLNMLSCLSRMDSSSFGEEFVTQLRRNLKNTEVRYRLSRFDNRDRGGDAFAGVVRRQGW
jgi:hypothetical protein